MGRRHVHGLVLRAAVLRAVVAGVVLVASLALPRAGAGAAPTLPPGFVATTTPTGQDAYDLTDFAFLPDGSALTTGKRGRVTWVPPAGEPRRIATLPVFSQGDLGLVGIALAADFADSGRLYTTRALTTPAGRFHRLSRWRLVRGPSGPTALADEVVILEAEATTAAHGMTGIVADADGTLWVSIGDSSDFTAVDFRSLRVQDPDTPYGKVLHITPDGRGVPSNPRFDPAAPASWRSRMFALGFRSPFRLTLDRRSGLPVVGDVGWNTREEVDLVRPGSNHGWPCWEGEGRTPGYEGVAACADVVPDAPVASYPRSEGGSITGGIFYEGSSYPEALHGAYVFGDFASQRIWTMAFDRNGVVERPREVGGFLASAGGPVAFRAGQNGDIVYADLYSAQLVRLSWAPGNRAPAPVIGATSDPQTLGVRLDATASTDPDGDALTYSWDLGDGTTATGPVVSHTYADGTARTVRLVARDALGAETAAEQRVVPSNHTPVLTVAAPPPGARFAVGDLVRATATASDVEDGEVSVRWDVAQEHCRDLVCHTHPGAAVEGGTFEETFPDHGDESSYRLTATATDAEGAVARQTLVVQPRLRALTVDGDPAVELNINGLARRTAQVVAGSRNSVGAPAEGSDGAVRFERWSDGGAADHALVMPDADLHLVAAYRTPLSDRYAAEPGLQALLGQPVGSEHLVGATRVRRYQRGNLYWTRETGVHEVHGDVLARYEAVGGPLSHLGVPTSDELPLSSGSGRMATFSNGSIVYSGGRAYDVRGPIDARWGAFGRERGFLGVPVALEERPREPGRSMDFVGGTIAWSPATGAWEVYGDIARRWRELGKAGGTMGYPTTGERSVAGGARASDFQAGSIVWTSATGSHEVYGEIFRRWSRVGREGGVLGHPITGEVAGSREGRLNRFRGGTVAWTPSTGAWEVYGGIHARWRAIGADAGVLGYPITGEQAGPAGGRSSRFEGGTIAWTPATGGWEVHGLIHGRWRQIGGEGSVVGYPTSPEQASGNGRISRFERGVVAWSGGTGAWEVYGGILDRWRALGEGRSPLGFPTSGEVATPRGRASSFAGGSIHWSPSTGAWEVYGAIRSRWLALGGETGALGLPVSGEYAVSGGRRSDFQGGSITWTRATGATTVTYRR